MTITVTSGIILGLIGGYTLQRGGFCMHTAFRSIVYEKDHSILRAWLLILVINIPVLLLLEELAVIFPARPPLTIIGTIAGSFVFGIGMVLAGGCVSGTYYRAAKGMMGSWFALIGFAAGASMISGGILSVVRRTLLQWEISILGEEATLYNIPAAFLPNFYPSTAYRIILVIIIVIPMIWFLMRDKKSQFQIGWTWQKTGVILAFVSLGAWYFSSLSFRDYGLSIVQPTIAFTRFFLFGDGAGINWSFWFLLGLPAGAFTAAVRHGDASFRLPPAHRTVQNLGGGFLMGIGAGIAGGCNIGHGITGLSTLSLGSLLATVTTMGGVWAATGVIFFKVKQKAMLSS